MRNSIQKEMVTGESREFSRIRDGRSIIDAAVITVCMPETRGFEDMRRLVHYFFQGHNYWKKDRTVRWDPRDLCSKEGGPQRMRKNECSQNM